MNKVLARKTRALAILVETDVDGHCLEVVFSFEFSMQASKKEMVSSGVLVAILPAFWRYTGGDECGWMLMLKKWRKWKWWKK